MHDVVPLEIPSGNLHGPEKNVRRVQNSCWWSQGFILSNILGIVIFNPSIRISIECHFGFRMCSGGNERALLWLRWVTFAQGAKSKRADFLNSHVAVSMLLLLSFGWFRHFQDCRLDFEKSSKLTFSWWKIKRGCLLQVGTKFLLCSTPFTFSHILWKMGLFLTATLS